MRYWLAATQEKAQVMNAKIDDTELRGLLEHIFEHQDLMRHLVHTVLVVTQQKPPTCKESHLMPLPNQLFSEIRYKSFRSPVIFGLNALVKRCDLSG